LNIVIYYYHYGGYFVLNIVMYYYHYSGYYPVRACAKGLSNRFCLSVSQSVQWKILKS